MSRLCKTHGIVYDAGQECPKCVQEQRDELLAACKAAHEWFGRFACDGPPFGGEAEIEMQLGIAIFKVEDGS